MPVSSAPVTRARLEALLGARRLDITLATAGPPDRAPDALATGVPGLDDRLGGGLPRGELSEIVGPRSSGRTSVLAALLASATRQGEMAALVDGLDQFDPPSGAAAGIVLSRLLWVRGPAVGASGPSDARVGARTRRVEGDLLTMAVTRAIKAFGLILQAGGFGLVGLDLADVPPAALQRLPFTTWRRLHRMVEGTDTACALLASTPTARSAGGVTVLLGESQERRACWSGESERARLLAGIDVAARVARTRLAPAQGHPVRLSFHAGELPIRDLPQPCPPADHPNGTTARLEERSV